MKIFSALVIAAVLLHVQCGDSCLVDSLHAKAPDPPCHQHSEKPVKDHATAHEGSALCNERSGLGSGGLQVMAVLPDGGGLGARLEASIFSLTTVKPPGFDHSNVLSSVRRI